MGVVSPVRTRTPTYYLDFTLVAGSTLNQEIPSGWTAFVYTLRGKIKLGEELTVEPHHTVLFTRDGEGVQIENCSDEEAHLVLIAGKPLGEPVAQHGPFVMNTDQELEQAFRDFRQARNGFEKAKTWRSSAGNA